MLRDMLPTTTHRVNIHTKTDVNEQIRNETILNLNIFKNTSNADKTERLRLLKFEWDTERVLETNCSIWIMLLSILGLTTKKKWIPFSLIGLIGLSMLQHALFGWCPPLPIIRKLGVRTAEEIGIERMVLKMVRKDFETNNKDIDRMMSMVEK